MTALLALLAVWAGALVDGHVHKAPHSGVIAHAGPYHLELVVKDHLVQVWLLDGQERTVPPPPGSSLSLVIDHPLERPIKGTRRVALQRATDHFECPFRMDPMAGFTADAQLTVRRQRLRARFVVTLLDFRDRLDDTLDTGGEKLDDSSVDFIRQPRQ
jgi:hypothetical protein